MITASPASSQNILEQTLIKLPSLTRDEIVSLFKEDLQEFPESRVVGNLKMACMFMDPVAVEELKKSIVKILHQNNKKSKELVHYLKESVYEEIMDQESILMVKKPHTEFPKTDHFDSIDLMEISALGGLAAKHISHRFKDVLQDVEASLPQEFKENFSKNTSFKKRFESTIVTYLKDIRDELETRQRMVARVTEGGLGLAHSLVDSIFSIISRSKKGVRADKEKGIADAQPHEVTQGKEVIFEKVKDMTIAEKLVPKEALVTAAPASVDHKKLRSLYAKEELLDRRTQPQMVKKEASVKPHVPQPLAKLSPIKPQVEEFVSPQTSALPTSPLLPQLRKAPLRTEGMTDVAKPIFMDAKERGLKDRLVSPTEEFAHITHEDIQKEESADEFVKKIVKKIEMLSEKNYNNRVLSISAWRMSPLYQEYLSVGERSLIAKMSVEDYLTNAADALLTPDEFNAIASLNQQLRF